MTLPPGFRLGPYEVLGLLGKGGMGEVYRARDPRIGRDVAVKVLRAPAADAVSLRELELEARAIGAVTHPNVVVVHDVGTDVHQPYVVMELLEGQTLRTRLRAAGALDPRLATEWAAQLASGLAAAHARGVIHRDLKPENVFITREGRPKIVDFGLARLLEPQGDARPDQSTVARATAAGAIVGTPAYMSPEQLRGQPADERSDIFALGLLLYEMVAGERAFPGDSLPVAMAAILEQEAPDLASVRPGSPAALARIVARCLAKDPAARFQSSADLAFCLDAPDAARGGSPPPLARAAEPRFRCLTFRRGNLLRARFTPDGQSVVYSAAWDGQPAELFTLRIEGTDSRPLGLVGADVLAVSKRGEIALLRAPGMLRPPRQGTLARVPLVGGAPRDLLEGVVQADWGPDGDDLAIVRPREGEAVLEYPPGEVVYRTTRRVAGLRVAPDGQHLALLEYGVGPVAFAAADASRLVVVDRKGAPVLLVPHARAGTMAWSPDGREVWLSSLEAYGHCEFRAHALSGHSRVVLTVPGELEIQDISSAGRVLVEGGRWRTELWLVEGSDGTPRNLSWLDGSVPVDLSADGRQLLFLERHTGGGARGAIYLRDADGSPAVQLGEGQPLALSPDARRVLARAAGDATTLLIVPTGAGGSTRVSTGGVEVGDMVRFLPGGERFLFAGREPGQRARLYVQEVAGGTPAAVGGHEGDGPFAVSPDGAGVVAVDATRGMRRVALDGSGSRPIPGARPDELPVRWCSDGGLLVQRRGSTSLQVDRLDLETGRRQPWKELKAPDPAGVVGSGMVIVSQDGRTCAFCVDRVAASELYLVDGLL